MAPIPATAKTRVKKKSNSPESQLNYFLDKYTPDIAAMGRDCLEIMRARLPGATQLVYDNYNALVIGFGPSEKPSDAIFSIVLYPRYITLFFLQGAQMPDPRRLLKGSGNVVRHIKLESPADLEKPAIRELMTAALKSPKRSIDPDAFGGLVIRSISAKQRPRRPT